MLLLALEKPEAEPTTTALEGVVASKSFLTVVREMGNADFDSNEEGWAGERSDDGIKMLAEDAVEVARVERY